MRLAISLKSHDPRLGGPGTYTIELLRHLLALDRENQYLLLYPSNPGVLSYLGQYTRYTNVHEVSTGIRSGLFWDLVVVPWHCARWKADLLFSPSMSLPVAGRFKKAMTVLGAERYTVPGLLPLKRRLRWRIMETLMLPQADAVLSLSDTMKRDFCGALGYPEEKVHTVPLGVSDDFNPVTDPERLAEVRARYGLPDEFLLFVGHLFPNKNFGNLIRGLHTIAEEIPHLLVVVGGRRWKYETELELVEELGLLDRVLFLRVVPKDDLVALYSMATCLVFPSLYESFGLALLEAMACGCPVVASASGALPEVAGDAAVFCDPHDPAAIGAAVLKLTSEPALRARCAARGLTRAGRFTWDACARGTLQVLLSLFSVI